MSDQDPGANLVARRRRQLGGVAVIAVVAAGAGLAAGGLVRSPASVAADTAPPPATMLTADVERRVITATVVARGEARIGGRISLTPGPPPEGMKAVVTRVGTEAGDQVRSGQVLLEVAERPMFLLHGAFPMYRDITPGSSGKDVAQLQESLRELGWRVADAAGYYGTSTQLAVVGLYRQMGYLPLREEVAAATPDEDDEAGPGAADAARPRPRAGGPIVPAAECFFVRSPTSTVTKLDARIGGVVRSPAISLSTSAVTVRANVNPADADGLEDGQRARIQDEAGTLDVTGRVTHVGAPRVAGDAGMSIPVTIRPDKPLASRWAGREVRVSFPQRQTARPVLAVPLSAVSAGVDGSTRVVVMTGATRRRIEVRAGRRGDGYVEVTATRGSGLAPGDRVLLGR